MGKALDLTLATLLPTPYLRVARNHRARNRGIGFDSCKIAASDSD